MKRLALPLAACTLCALAALPARADSFASSASDSVSTSIGKLSDSVSDSSHSSTQDRHAQGEYHVTDVAAVDGRPNMVRLQLQPTQAAQGGALSLTVPRAAAERGGVGAGTQVVAYERPYGTEFTAGPQRQPFFIAVTDAWAQELQTTKIDL